MKTIAVMFLMLVLPVLDLMAQNLNETDERRIEVIETTIANNNKSLENSKLKKDVRISFLESNNEKKNELIEIYKKHSIDLVNDLENIKKELAQKEIFFSEETSVFDNDYSDFDISGLPRREQDFILMIRNIRQINSQLDKVLELINNDALSREELQNQARDMMDTIEDQIFELKNKEQEMNILLSEKQLDYYERNIKNRYNKYLEMIY